MADLDRVVGSLVGLAVGDALGTTLEFRERDTYEPSTDMVGGGPFRLQKGQWTDDTSMALCLAASIEETGQFDLDDQMRRYVAWRDEGYLSSTGVCFDIGSQTNHALDQYLETGVAQRSDVDSKRAGNGSLMRVAPVGMRYADPEEAGHFGTLSSMSTHPSRECHESCGAYAALITSGINGATRDDVVAMAAQLAERCTAQAVQAVLGGSFVEKTRDQISSSGYVIDSLEAALWAFAHSSNFREGALLAVNLGDDADTVGAIYGQLAGAVYGLSGIPSEWIEPLAMRDLILQLGARLGRMRS